MQSKNDSFSRGSSPDPNDEKNLYHSPNPSCGPSREGSPVSPDFSDSSPQLAGGNVGSFGYPQLDGLRRSARIQSRAGSEVSDIPWKASSVERGRHIRPASSRDESVISNAEPMGRGRPSRHPRRGNHP